MLFRKGKNSVVFHWHKLYGKEGRFYLFIIIFLGGFGEGVGFEKQFFSLTLYLHFPAYIKLSILHIHLT